LLTTFSVVDNLYYCTIKIYLMSYKEKLLRHYHIIAYLSIKPKDWNSIRNRVVDKVDGIAEDYNIRTFQRDIQAINELFAVEIKFNAVIQAYEIVNNEHSKECINALSLLILRFNESEKRTNVISNEAEGLGSVHLTDIIEAMENNFSIQFEYSKYSEPTTKIRKVIPILLRQQNRRWYLLGEDLHKEKLRVFGLDRMENLEIEFKRLKSRYPFDECIKIWDETMGIETGNPGQKSEIIVLRVDSNMAGYIKSMPWHYSQKLVNENSEYSDFEFKLIVTNDLINKIMSFIQFVKIIKPVELKDQILKNLMEGIEKNK